MGTSELLSVVAPVYNEEPSIREFVERIVKVASSISDRYELEIVLVDDGSEDKSLEIMKELTSSVIGLRVIELRRNYGQTSALQAGLDAAKGSVIVTMDADLQHFPEEIPAFVEKIEQGYDMVCGWRKDRAEGFWRRFPSAVANRIVRRISRIDIHDFGTTFRAYRSELVRDMMLFGELHRYIPVLGKQVGGRIAEIPIRNIERPAGSSKYGLGRTPGVMLDLMVLFFLFRHIDRPMRAFGKIAALHR